MPPEITIRAEDADGRVRLSVCDNGIGIAAEDRERIFEPFQRLHRQDEYPGTGVGLALCRRIAQRHGGGIRVDSAPGQGACFTVDLPAAEQAANRASA